MPETKIIFCCFVHVYWALLPSRHYSLLFLGLLGGLGDLSVSLILLGDCLDDTDGNGLPHVTHGKTSQRWVVAESLYTHVLLGGQFTDGGISRLDKLGVVFQLLVGTTINLLLQFNELAGNMGGVAIQHWRISSLDLARVVQDDHLQQQKMAGQKAI